MPAARPRLVAPPLACDCHAHVYGPLDRYPYRPNRRYTPAAAGLAEYLQMLEALALTRAVIVQPDLYLDHRVTADAIIAAAGRGMTWRGVARLTDTDDEAVLEQLHHQGFRAARFNLRSPEPALLAQVASRCEQIAALGWHAQFHLFGKDLPTLADWISRLPTPVVLDHFARLMPQDDAGRETLFALLRTSRVHVKLSSPYRLVASKPPYAELDALALALTDRFADRLVWGSDWPHSSFGGYMPNDADLFDTLLRWTPDPGVRHRILVDNPALLYQFE